MVIKGRVYGKLLLDCGKWDACEQALWGHSDHVYSFAFSPDGSHVVSGSKDRTVRIWNVVTGESEAKLKGHSGWVNSVVFSPDGSHVVSGSDDGTMHFWNVATGEFEAELKRHSCGVKVNSVDFSPDGSLVVSGSVEQDMRHERQSLIMPCSGELMLYDATWLIAVARLLLTLGCVN